MDDKPCEPRFWLKRLRSVWCAVCQSPPLPPHPPPNATHRIEGAVSDLREREQAGGHITPLDEVQMVIDKETGIDRLRKMFTKDHVGHWSREMNSVYESTSVATVFTFVAVALLNRRYSKQQFISSNKLSVYRTHFHATRQLNDSMIMFAMKEGSIWALRVGLFTFSFLMTSTLISSYRNKTTPWEYLAASIASVSLFRLTSGVRGLIGGCIFGSVVGLGSGLLLWSILVSTGQDQRTMHFYDVMHEVERQKVMEEKGANIPPLSTMSRH